MNIELCQKVCVNAQAVKITHELLFHFNSCVFASAYGNVLFTLLCPLFDRHGISSYSNEKVLLKH